ncbi:hypothetical protein [Grimontia marina]|uniref:Chromosome partition protein Smc n=1 Tax=Grimontia marina TaxID=646534 RepID=A0A128FKS0_9GAMM|nr:hypothetical protein [Grimontia marina]CZF86816.1 hypothetical protein GMA8713_04855 [Grimontia marina]
MYRKVWMAASVLLSFGVLYSAFDMNGQAKSPTATAQTLPKTTSAASNSFDAGDQTLNSTTTRQISKLHEQIKGDYTSEIADAEYRDELIEDLNDINKKIDSDSARLDGEARMLEQGANEEADLLIKKADALLARLESNGYRVVESSFDVTAPVEAPEARRVTDELNRLSTELQSISERFENLGRNGNEEIK